VSELPDTTEAVIDALANAPQPARVRDGDVLLPAEAVARVCIDAHNKALQEAGYRMIRCVWAPCTAEEDGELQG
jgi:hypothetical protein